MRSDVNPTGNKVFKDESLVKLFNSPTIRAGSLKKSKQRVVLRDFYRPILMNYVID